MSAIWNNDPSVSFDDFDVFCIMGPDLFCIIPMASRPLAIHGAVALP